MTDKIKTPRTQAAISNGWIKSGTSGEEFCKTLERDLTLVTQERDALKAVVDELAKIGDAVCDLEQNRNRSDSQPIMAWDDAKLTLGTIRLCRALKTEGT